jgi:hypothetical protein
MTYHLHYYLISLILSVVITPLAWAIWMDDCYDFRRWRRRRILSIWTLILPIGCVLTIPALALMVTWAIAKYGYLLIYWALGGDDQTNHS